MIIESCLGSSCEKVAFNRFGFGVQATNTNKTGINARICNILIIDVPPGNSFSSCLNHVIFQLTADEKSPGIWGAGWPVNAELLAQKSPQTPFLPIPMIWKLCITIGIGLSRDQMMWGDRKSLFPIWGETALPSTTHWLERTSKFSPYWFLLLADLYMPWGDGLSNLKVDVE